MILQTKLVVLSLACVTAAALSTASIAQEGRGPMPIFPFDTVDADKDGKITQAELDAFRTAQIVAADANADGKLVADELTAMHLTRMTERATSMAADMIKRLDTDADMALSVAELEARPMPAMLLEKADADGDGAVTKAEAEALQGKIAKRMEGRHGKGRHGGWWGMMGDH